MKKKLKIAIYSGDIPSTTFIERLIIGLSKKGNEILLFGRIKKKVRYSQNVLIKGYSSGKLQKGVYLMYYSLLLRFFRNKEKRKLDQILASQSRDSLYDKVKCYPVLWHKPDIFHIQWAKGLSEWVWVKEFGIKIVLSLRGAHINYSPIANLKLAQMYREHFPKVDVFHAVSQAIAKEATKYNAPEEKIEVVYSGLDLNIFNYKNSNLISQSPVFSIISVGRPHWKKGYGYALDAFKLVKNLGCDFKYTIVGGVNLELTYQIKELGLEHDIIVLNHVPFDEVQKRIKASDLLFLPSAEEGIANVVLEAMSTGVLVLTTDCGGMEEVVVDGINGFVTPIRNAHKMAKKILEISQISDNQKKQMTSKALETIHKQHSEELMIDGMLDLYSEI